MYAGPSAVNFNVMAKQGATFSGKFDGKPRFEIDDSEAQIIQQGLAQLASGKQTKLRDVLQHSELFRAYPCLRELSIKINNNSDDLASYSRRDGSITIFEGCIDQSNESSARKIRSCIIHELQHCIQHIEGFTPGASASLLFFLAHKSKKQELGDSIGRHDKLDTKILQELRDGAICAYKATAGEIESRDVEARIFMTKDERVNTAPYSSEHYTAEQARDPIEYKDGTEEKLTAAKLRTAQVASKTASMMAGLFGSTTTPKLNQSRSMRFTP